MLMFLNKLKLLNSKLQSRKLDFEILIFDMNRILWAWTSKPLTEIIIDSHCKSIMSPLLLE